MTTITLGTKADLPELSALYDRLNDYLENHINYPGWKKGVYPTYQTALEAVEEKTLFAARINGQLAGTVILRPRPEAAYATADWGIALTQAEVLVVYTLAVHPDFLGQQVGMALMKFTLAHAKAEGYRAVRLDVYEKNLPAIALYEKCGFAFIARVDLGYSAYGLDWYSLYQRLL